MNLDVDIHLKQGQFLLHVEFKCIESALGIFGPSGCGKSTLFRALAGLVRPDAGHISLNGHLLFHADRRVFIPPHQRHIGLVFQDARLFPHWSVEQNLRAGECLKERISGRPFSFDDIVDLLNIENLIGRSVDDLSGGEKQRIAIGRTLLSNPKLLLMDEPVTGLDVSLKMQILPFLANVHQTLAIPSILISHDLGEILQLDMTHGHGQVAQQVSFPGRGVINQHPDPGQIVALTPFGKAPDPGIQLCLSTAKQSGRMSLMIKDFEP